MTHSVLIANRGEIAVRAVRAGRELGWRTVAVFAEEDRNSVHRGGADEAYRIDCPGSPVDAYLDIEQIVAAAVEAHCDVVYPGYGFLAENASFAAACAEAGLTFAGPAVDALTIAGDKVLARDAAVEAGVPVLRATGPFLDAIVGDEAVEVVGFPLFVKAVAGGGGRGMRLVERPADLREAVAAAVREARAAFGDGRVFLEQAFTDARHIEVQVLGDGTDVVHLYERDCSLQRRRQKLVEIAPAPGLDETVRNALCADAVRLARHLRYKGAGTVEYLVAPDGSYVFIEMNPRIQVEHTVTEETTGVDLVRAQLLIATGVTLRDLGIDQEALTSRGAAVQCRITTEDPAAGFVPDTGRIEAVRLPAGPGVRIDEGNAYPGADIEPYFDSMLLKVTCRGRDHADAMARTRRALRELHVEGVRTNTGFLLRVLTHPAVEDGTTTTTFVDQNAAALTATDGHAGNKLVRWVVEATVKRPHGPAPTRIPPSSKLPPLDMQAAPPGSRTALRRLGPDEFSRALRSQVALAVTDTTFRDAHQSLLATRVRTHDLLAVAPHMARLLPELWSVEAWGGATYDVALRFLAEDPWERLARLRDALPGTCIQMLLRGRNTVAYEPRSDRTCRAFVAEAASTGVDVFRVFDALNDVSQMRPAIEAVIETQRAVCEGAICYTGDLTSPGERIYTLDYYLRLAEELVSTGVHVIGIKDMAGLLRAPAAATLVSAVRERFDQPVHLHTHDTAGGQLATYLAAVHAGVDAVDVAAAAMAGTTSQPSLAALVAATDGTARATGIDLEAANALEPYWEAVRALYAPFEAGLRAPTGRVYEHEIPGGQLSNLRQQAVALGLGDRFEDVQTIYAACDRLLGRIVKVTPTSKVVGDLALALAASGVTPDAFGDEPSLVDLPMSVVRFLQGELGTPPGGWTEPFRTKALAPHGVVSPAVAEPADARLESDGPERQAALNAVLFPAETRVFEEYRSTYGDVSRLPTDLFLYGAELGVEHCIETEPGRAQTLCVEAVTDPDPRGRRTVFARVDGRVHAYSVVDAAGAVTAPGSEKADPLVPGHIAAPFAGVATVRCLPGDEVAPGMVVASIEAMKMESSVTTPLAGRVARVVVERCAAVAAGDLLVVVEPTTPPHAAHAARDGARI